MDSPASSSARAVVSEAHLSVSERVAALRPYQPGKPIDEVRRELGITGEIVKLASNENPLGASPTALQVLRERAAELFLYPDAGCRDLRLAVSEKLCVDGNMLIFGNGSDEIIHLLGLTFLEAGDEAIIAQPTFVLYEAATTLAGATPVRVPLTRPGYAHDLAAIGDALTDKTRLIFVANPHNPTGTVVTRRDMDKLIAKLPPRALLVLDEAYGEYAYHLADFPRALDYIRDGAPVVGLRTFSKMYGLAGLRVGFGVADTRIIARLEQPRSPFNVNLAAQWAAIAAVKDDEFVARSFRANADGLAQLYAGCERLGLCYVPSFANFVMIDTQKPCRAVFQSLLQQGVIVRTGDIFGMPTFIRVTVGTQHQNARFLDALANALNEVSV